MVEIIQLTVVHGIEFRARRTNDQRRTSLQRADDQKTYLRTSADGIEQCSTTNGICPFQLISNGGDRSRHLTVPNELC
jgi:hypothetical protein